MMRAMVLRVSLAETEVVDDPALRDLLDAAERARADRKRAPSPFVTAHAHVRRVLGDLLGVDPASLAFDRHCPTCGSTQHGKPTIVGHPQWSYSLSYTDALAVVAVAQGPELGVDVEHVTEADFGGFAQVTLAPEEADGFAGHEGEALLAARAQVWARKEAILKATGHGLVVDPTEVLVTGPDEAPALVDWRAREERPTAVTLADVVLRCPDHRASVAALTDEPVEVVTLP